MTASHPVPQLERLPDKTPTIQDLALLVYDYVTELLRRLMNEPNAMGFTLALEIKSKDQPLLAEAGSYR